MSKRPTSENAKKIMQTDKSNLRVVVSAYAYAAKPFSNRDIKIILLITRERKFTLWRDMALMESKEVGVVYLNCKLVIYMTQ